MRDKYYQKMFDYKYAILYLEKYLDETIKVLRRWKIFIAVGSSAAIACWTAWSGFAYYWGLIIVVTQVTSVILEYMPYETRKEELSKALSMKKSIYTDMEHDWDEIEINWKSDKEISTLLYKYNKKWENAEDEVFKNNSLAQNEKIRVFAEGEAIRYFDSLKVGEYGGEEQK